MSRRTVCVAASACRCMARTCEGKIPDASVKMVVASPVMSLELVEIVVSFCCLFRYYRTVDRRPPYTHSQYALFTSKLNYSFYFVMDLIKACPQCKEQYLCILRCSRAAAPANIYNSVLRYAYTSLYCSCYTGYVVVTYQPLRRHGVPYCRQKAM